MVEKETIPIQKIFNLINDLNLSLRLLEQKINKIETEIENFHMEFEKINRTLIEKEEIIKQEVARIREDLNNVIIDFEKINLDLKKKADKMEVKELREFFDLFNPLKSNFVTKDEVKRMLKELININEK